MEGLGSWTDMAASASSFGSSDIDNIRKTSVLLRMVVEQLICPPMKKAARPFASNNGAICVYYSVDATDGRASMMNLPT